MAERIVADRKLFRDIALVVTIKLVLLAALWWAFVRDERVTVDAEAMRAHVAAPAAAAHSIAGERHDQ